MKTIKELVDESLAGGWTMVKELSSGFFGTTYDRRKIHSREELYKLNKEGFLLEDNAGVIAINILLKSNL